MRKRQLALMIAASMWVLGAAAVPAHASTASGAASSTFTVQLDSQAPSGESWDFLRLFPDAIAVHQGDVIDAAWGGLDAPHTASFVASADAEQWRADNQCDGCAYAPFWPDALLGGDDPELDLNPAMLYPSSFTCGTAGAPCSFDGSSVVNSGLQFSAPGAQPHFFVQIDAKPGSYTMMCLLHPGMEIPLAVRSPLKGIPTPDQVAARGQRQAAIAAAVDGTAADAIAQTVTTQGFGNGHIEYTINAGGFSNQVTANEYVDAGLSLKVGDKLTVVGSSEIHTATTPRSSVNTVPFLKTQCEVPGPDIPAFDPSECASPSDFQVALNNKALAPAAKNNLVGKNRYRNSGLLAGPVSYTFVAQEPGTYIFVCLVHGPSMTTTVTVTS